MINQFLKTLFTALRDNREEFVRHANDISAEMAGTRDPHKVLNLLSKASIFSTNVIQKVMEGIPEEYIEDVLKALENAISSEDPEVAEMAREAMEFNTSLDESIAPENRAVAAVQLLMDEGLLEEYMRRIGENVDSTVKH